MVFKHFDIFSKWPPMKVVLMFYTVLTNEEKLHLYKDKEYKQTLMLNYRVIGCLQIIY